MNINTRDNDKSEISKKEVICFSFHVLWRVGYTSFMILCCVGITYGFNSLKPMLYEEKMYHFICKNQTVTFCDEQTELLNSVFQFTLGVSQVLKVFIGIFIDVVPVKLYYSANAILNASCFCLFGFLVKFRVFDRYFFWLSHLSMSAWAYAGLSIYWVMQKYYLFLIPERLNFLLGVISAMYNSAFDLGSIIFLIFLKIHQRFNVDPIYFIEGIAVFIFVGYFFFIFLMTPPKNRLSKEKKETKKEKFNIKEYVKAASKEIFHLQFLFKTIWMGFSMLQFQFAISTILDQSVWLVGEEEAQTYNSVWSILFPIFGFSVSVPLGLFANFHKTIIVFAICINFLFGISMVLMVFYPPLQYVMYVFLIISRNCVYLLGYHLTTLFVSPACWGVVNSCMYTISGVFAELQILLNYFVYRYMNGSFLIINIVLACVGAVGNMCFFLGFPVFEFLGKKIPITRMDGIIKEKENEEVDPLIIKEI